MDEIKKLLRSSNFERFKYPLLVLVLGVFLMLLPLDKKSNVNTMAEGDNASIAQILSRTKGVGDCVVLASDKGVVVVCEGADNARIRLEIIQALSSYTGYSSDRITILKMAE